MPNAAIHPTPQELTAFARGKLPDAVAAAVAGHLDKCSECRKAIDNLPGVSFVGKVRAAKPDASSLPARAGNAANAAAPSAPPKNLPPDLAHYAKYRFLRELGRGGMGVVYQAEQTVMGRMVAVKVINPRVLDHPDALPRFQGEVKAAAKLDHANIVRAYDAEQVGSMHLLVMEYIEGTSLAELVKKKGPQSVAYACHYIRQAALGLQHAFEQGMVHRDIKPQNLMVNLRGQVKVLDFGLARMRSERKAGCGLTQADTFMGTPEYVAPEQATDARSADTRADIYSLGCTLFFVLTGRPPFQEDTMVKMILAQIEKEPPALHDMRADVPAELSAVVARMLAKDPAQRFQTPIEVEQALAVFVKPGAKRPAAGVSPPAPGAASPATGTMIAANTSKIKAILGDLPGKAPAKEAVTGAFAGLGEAAVSAKKKAKPARKTAKPATAAWWKRPGVLAAAVGVSLALILMAVIIIKIKVPPTKSTPSKVMAPKGDKDDRKPHPAETIVVLEIDQPGAKVSVDGKIIKVNLPGENKPIEIKVEPGKHKVEVKKDGFIAHGEEVILEKGGRRIITAKLEKMQPLPLSPPPAKTIVVLEIDQPGSEVRLDGRKIKDPVPGENKTIEITVEPGKHRVEVKKDGFKAYGEEVTIENGRRRILTVRLEKKQPAPPPAETIVVLEIDQPGAEVFVDGKKIAVNVPGDREPIEIKVEPGQHKLRVRKEGFEVVSRDVELKSGRSAPIRVRLEPVKTPFVSLFNGKDLAGWMVSGNRQDWQVLDGILTGSRRTGGPTGLFTNRVFGDFHLRVETTIAEGNNSYIQFRQGSKGWYIVHIDGTTPSPGDHTGDLGFSTKGLTHPTSLAPADPVIALKPGEWFSAEIVAKGANLTVLLKGKTVATFDDPERRFSSGVIQLVCRGNSKARFRKIEIKELPANKPKAPPADKAEALAAESKGLARAAPAKAKLPDDGFQVGAKLVGTYSPSWINRFNGKREFGGSNLEVKITKRSGREFTAEFWWGKLKDGAQYEGTIENGQVKARMTKALTDNTAKQKGVGNNLFTGRLIKGALTGTVRRPKVNTTFRGEVKVKLSKE